MKKYITPKNITPIIHITDDNKEEIINLHDVDYEDVWFCMQQMAWEESQENK